METMENILFIDTPHFNMKLSTLSDSIVCGEIFTIELHIEVQSAMTQKASLDFVKLMKFWEP